MTEEIRERSFLERLWTWKQQHVIPVVDESFVQEFQALDEDDQAKAMDHIFYMGKGDDLMKQQSRVNAGRLAALYKAWYEDQTENWVDLYYKPPIDAIYWKRYEEREKTVSLEDAKKLIMADHVEPGQESAVEDAVINAFLEG